MSDLNKPVRNAIAAVLEVERTGVLALGGESGEPYAALVAFLPSADLDRLYFATLRTTRKYQRILAQPHVALLIDTRQKTPDDFREATVLTALGKVDEPGSSERKTLALSFTGRFPTLSEFVADPQCALLCIHVSRYILVEQFQQVREWALR